MSLRGSTRRRRVGGAAAVLALVWAVVPVRAHAGPEVSGTVFDSAICQISLTITTTSSVSMSIPASLTPGTGYSITASAGTCTEVGTTQPFAVSASGTTYVTATCADFVVLGGGATVSIGTAQYPTTMYMAGPGAGSQWVMEMTPVGLGTGGAGVAELALDPASLQACTHGGASTLNFSGGAVFLVS